MNFPSSMKRETLFVREGRKKLLLTNFRIIINTHFQIFRYLWNIVIQTALRCKILILVWKRLLPFKNVFFFFIREYSEYTDITIYIYKFWIFFDYSTNLKENFYSNSIRYTVTNKTGFKLFVTFVLLLISTNKIESNFKLYFFLSLSLSSI